MAENTANFRFAGYKIIESTVKVEDGKDVSQELNVEFNQTVGVNESEQNMRLEFITTITDKNNSLAISVKAFGYFVFDKGLQDSEKDSFFRINAPAILYPYVRAYITTLTSLSGLKPIILPTLNLSKR